MSNFESKKLHQYLEGSI